MDQFTLLTALRKKKERENDIHSDIYKSATISANNFNHELPKPIFFTLFL